MSLPTIAGEALPGDAAGSWEPLDHPADLRLRLRAPGPAALYRVAVEALVAVIRGESPDAATGLDTTGRETEVDVHLVGFDAGDLLVCLCNEVLYRLESEGRLAQAFTPTVVTPTELEGTLLLAPPGPPAELLDVKAATYGALRWERSRDGHVLAEITLDL